MVASMHGAFRQDAVERIAVLLQSGVDIAEGGFFGQAQDFAGVLCLEVLFALGLDIVVGYLDAHLLGGRHHLVDAEHLRHHVRPEERPLHQRYGSASGHL